MKQQYGKAKSFQDLIVWQKNHKVVLQIYKATYKFPKEEMFGLTSQFRRASISISANIAEGFGREGKQDKRRFMNIAKSSLEECRYYLILSKDLGYEYNKAILESLDEVGRILHSYTKHIV